MSTLKFRDEELPSITLCAGREVEWSSHPTWSGGHIDAAVEDVEAQVMVTATAPYEWGLYDKGNDYYWAGVEQTLALAQRRCCALFDALFLRPEGGPMTSIPLTCPACNGTGGAQITWTSDGTYLTPPPWVAKAQRLARCQTCGGSGRVYYLFTPESPPLKSDLPSQLLDVREVSGCAECKFAIDGTRDVDCGIGVVQEDYWFCNLETTEHEGAPPTVAPDWCPLRKGPVTLRLKGGA